MSQDQTTPADSGRGDSARPGGTGPATGIAGAARSLWQGGSAYRVALLGTLGLSLALRLALVLEVEPLLMSDAADYHAYAASLLAGEGYQHLYEGIEPPFLFRAYRAPGYPLFLAGLYGGLGWSPRLGMLANALFELATLMCWALIAVRLLGRPAALMVAVLLGAHCIWTPSLMTESLYTALLSAIALLLVFRSKVFGPGEAAGLGVLAAAALAVRPITACIYPLLVWVALRAQGGTGRRLVRALLVLLPVALALSGWALRNHALFGELVLTTTNLGDHNAREFGIPTERRFEALRERGLNEAQINRAFLDAELRSVSAQPGAFLALWSRRSADLFSLAPAWELEAVLWQHGFGPRREDSALFRLHRAAYRLQALTYLAAVCGAFVILVRRRSLGVLWALGILYVVMHGAVSRGDLRLAAPLYPMLCLLASGCTLLPWRQAARLLHPAAPDATAGR